MRTHPLPQVVGEHQISGEVICEGGVKLQDFLQRVSFDDVEVAVGQRPHVSARLCQRHLLPEHVAKHVAFTCRHTERQVTVSPSQRFNSRSEESNRPYEALKLLQTHPLLRSTSVSLICSKTFTSSPKYILMEFFQRSFWSFED